MISDNPRKIKECDEIVDGNWTEWMDLGECKGTQVVEDLEDNKCGEGFKEQERNCTKTLGGRFCKLDDGSDYKGIIYRRSIECHALDCPSEFTIYLSKVNITICYYRMESCRKMYWRDGQERIYTGKN